MPPVLAEKPKPRKSPLTNASPKLAEVIDRINDVGEWPITKCDEANVPLNIVISEPDEFTSHWTLLADNFKPRSASIDIETYEVEAESKEDLLAIVHEIILPLYKAAVQQLETKGTCFFWSEK